MPQPYEQDYSTPYGARPEPAARNPLQIAWQRKSLVLLAAVVGVVAAALFAAQRPAVYQSAAQVLVIKKQSNLVPVAGGDPRTQVVDDFVATHLVVIKSRRIIDMAVEKGKLRDLPSFASAGIKEPAPVIIASLTATRDAKESSPNIINLTYKGPVAEDCRLILTAVIDSYMTFLELTYHNVSADTVTLITKAQDLLETKLKGKRAEYREFREDNFPDAGPPPARDGQSVPQLRLSDLEAKNMAVVVRVDNLQERLRAVEAARKDGTARDLVMALTAATEKIVVPIDVEAQLLPLTLQEQALLQDFGEEHPKVKEVRTKIRMTRELLTRASERRGPEGPDPVDAYVKGLKQQLAAAEVEKKSLGRLLDAEDKAARELRTYEDEDNEYRTDIAQTQALYDQTMKRLGEIDLIKEFGGFSVQELAKPGPGGRTGTAIYQMILAGLAAGLMLGIALAYLADAADKSFRTPEEIRRRLGLPVMAHVPILEEDGSPSSPDGPQLERSLAIFHRPTSAEAEAYRSARTALYFSTGNEVHKVIQVTSPNMGDGKSTIAANLAIAIAQSGKSVVLVDADLRRPRIGALFGLPAGGVGLTSVIGAGAELGDALQPSGVDKLTLLPCGPTAANPAELLTLPRFEGVLADLRGRFEFVIVDTPPLLAVTDPCVVAARVDGVLLVVRLGHKDRPAAERARETLAALGTNIVGVVVNGVGTDGTGYGYGYYQPGYGYGYGYGGEANGSAAANGETKGEANGHAAGGRKTKKNKKAGRWLTRWLR